MSREEFLERLNQVLDERRSPEDDAWLKARADEDSELRALLDGHVTLLEGVRQSAANTQPPAGLAQRVLADVKSQVAATKEKETSQPITAGQIVAWVAALAAAILLGLLPVLRHQPENGVAKAPRAPADAVAPEQVAKHNTPAPQTPEPKTQVTPETPAEPPIPVLVQQAGTHYLDLAEETRHSFSEMALLLPGVNNDTLENQPPRKPLVDKVEEGIKPFTRSVGGAFNFLFDSIPIDES